MFLFNFQCRHSKREKERRILNGDGGSWIKEAYDPDVIFQLDRYHIYQEILRKIGDKEAQKAVRELSGVQPDLGAHRRHERRHPQ